MTKEKLQNKYPQYFKNCWEFSIGNGWIHLISTICYYIDKYEKNLRDDLLFAKKYKNDDKSWWFGKLDEIKEKIKEIEENPFSWIQIKEKFGGLRAYCHGSSNEIDTMIRFAESLSFTICEDCGCPATVKTTGWIRTLCESCAIKDNRTYNKINYD